VILAQIADENLRRALLLFENNGFSFFAKQYVGHLLVISAIAVFIEGLLRERRTRRRLAEQAAQSAAETPAEAKPQS
jgi:putative tricarboxylic transport membrane protein